MVILGSSDLYQVKFASLVADYDRKTLIDLYMPIVGYTAISIYFALWANAEKTDLNLISDHQHLLVSMQMATGKFVEERKKLEGIGLLRTTIKKEVDVNIYTYQIFSPKTPAKFFSDSLLYGLLIKFVGEASASKLRTYYGVDHKVEDGKDISASYAEVFNPNFDDPAYKKALMIKKGEILDRIQSKVDSEFNFERFISQVQSSSQISRVVFTKKVLKEIERLTALYGVSEETAALCFIDCYDADKPKGERIDFKQMTLMFQNEQKYPFLTKNEQSPALNKISSDSVLAKKINMMEDISCKDFLQILQNNTAPVAADLAIVEYLSANLGLLPCVINAILDYTLQTNSNTLPRKLVEKIGASVAREGLKTAYDTMNYLVKEKNEFKKNARKTSKSREEKITEKSKKQDLTPVQQVEKEQIKDDFDDAEWEKMLKEIGGR